MVSRHKILFCVVIVIFVFMIWKCYWRIQLVYNSSSLSLYTPSIFKAKQEYSKEYDYRVKYGFRSAKTKTIIITTLLRDVEGKIPEIKLRSERMGKIFKDYRILIVENDSSDKTREKLIEWSLSNPKIIILGCGYNVKKCSIKIATTKTEGHGVNKDRIEKMVYLRNVYLDEVKKNYRNFDYMAVWDLDIIGSVYLDGVANSLSYFDNSTRIDAICAYGIYRWLFMTLYYDTYAHITDKKDEFHISEKLYHDIGTSIKTRYSVGQEPIQVNSCFSGFTIYRINSLLDPYVRYDMTPTENNNIECEHVRLNYKLKGKILMNPSMIHYVLLND